MYVINYLNNLLAPYVYPDYDIVQHKFNMLYLNTNYISHKAMLVNIFMVYKKGRKATLLEPANFYNEIRNKKIVTRIINELLVLVHELKLNHLEDNSKRILISSENIESKKINDDRYIGKMLGFYCTGHNYWDYKKKDRLSGSIYIDNDINVYAEVCEKDKLSSNHKNFKQYIRKLSQIYEKYKISNYKVDYNIDLIYSSRTLLNKLKNKDFNFINTNKYDYINYIYNKFGTSEAYTGKLFQNGKYINYMPVLLFLYKTNFFYKIFPAYNGNNGTVIHKISQKLLILEKQLYKNYDQNNEINIEKEFKMLAKHLFKNLNIT